MNEFNALIYEFMSGGSLETLLHHNKVGNTVELQSLNFLERLDIIIDIAHALEYLHNGTDLPIIHGDLKPSNIRLDQDMTAHIGDFGLSEVVSNMLAKPESSCSTTNGIRGNIYVPPGYGAVHPYQEKVTSTVLGFLCWKSSRAEDQQMKHSRTTLIFTTLFAVHCQITQQTLLIPSFTKNL